MRVGSYFFLLETCYFVNGSSFVIFQCTVTAVDDEETMPTICWELGRREERPGPVKDYIVLRLERDKRRNFIYWRSMLEAFTYIFMLEPIWIRSITASWCSTKMSIR